MLLDEYNIKDYVKILKKNNENARVLLGQETNCFRVYDRNIFNLDFTVDYYNGYAKIIDYSQDDTSNEDKNIIIDKTASSLYISKDNCIFQERRKGLDSSSISQNENEKENQKTSNLIVKENGLEFRVDLQSRLDTGLFLDNVYTRMLVEESSYGASVLNTFCYTGSFSVYAARGGAKRVVSLDAANSSIELAKENMERNGYKEGDVYSFVRADIKEWICGDIKEKFDLIIFDSPTLSRIHGKKTFDIQEDYDFCINKMWNLLTLGGVIIFQTNYTKFNMDKRKLIGFKTEDITDTLKAPNFSKKRITGRSYLIRKIPRKTEDIQFKNRILLSDLKRNNTRNSKFSNQDYEIKKNYNKSNNRYTKEFDNNKKSVLKDYKEYSINSRKKPNFKGKKIYKNNGDNNGF